MINVILEHKSPTDVMTLVYELRARGLQQGVDFDFSYHQASYNNDGYDAVTPRHAKFIFYNEKEATMFLLRQA
jgi:hypothetical protein